jgi:WD40 repeat protein
MMSSVQTSGVLQCCRQLCYGLTLVVLIVGCSDGIAPNSSFEVAVKGAQSASISDDGKHTIVGSIHHGGSLWRNADGERLYNWNHKQGEYTTLLASDISADGRWGITAGPEAIVLWDTKSGQSLRYWTAPDEILSIALSADGQQALLGLESHGAVLFKLHQGRMGHSFPHNNRVRSVDFSRDGSLAITGSEDYTAAVWDVSSGRKLHEVEHEDDVQMVALSPDGRLALSAAKYDRALVWETATGKVLGEVPLAAEKLRRGVRFTAARFSDDGKQLLTGRPDQIVQLWDTTSLTPLAKWKVPKRDAWKPTSAAIVAVGFDTKGGYVAVASNGFVHRLKR